MAEQRRPAEPTGSGNTILDGEATRTKGSGRHGSGPTSWPVVGDYRILRKLGSGGMGIVFEAEQQHPKRKVAVKIVRGGQFVDESRVRMFQREADTLARLEHPNIAAIHESGRTDDGQHFFAMELVQGKTLNEFLEDRPRVIDRQELRFRLGLMRKIAEAVHYAHLRGVIHRDLKPSNIIVGEDATSEESGSTITGLRLPQIKILDFGLARITEGDVAASTVHTEVGVIKGTLAYMSPEQAQGHPDEIDVRTDVYSLGMMLYELLAGRRPYDVEATSVVEAVRVISEETPRPLKQVWRGGRRLDPDIETIVGKALEKQRARRYGSAAEFATDIERFLTDQPILASPPSTAYRAAKFVRRHQMGVSVAAVGLLVLLVFAATMTVQATRIARERDQTRLEAATANQALEFLTGLFEVSNPSEARGNSITAREILDRGAEEIEESLADQPVAQARLMSTMGEVYLGLGLHSAAEPLLVRSVEIRRRELGDDHPVTLESINKVGAMYHYQGKLDEAEAYLREALETRRRELGDDDPSTLMSVNNMAALIQQRGKLDEAEPYRREAMQGYRRTLGDDHEYTLAAINNMGYLFYAQGRLEEAEVHFKQAMEGYRRVLGDDHPSALSSINNVGVLLLRLQKLDEAELYLLEALAGYRRVLGDDHFRTARAMGNLGKLYTSQERHDEAEAAFLEAHGILARTVGADNRDTQKIIAKLADLYDAGDKPDQADSWRAKLTR